MSALIIAGTPETVNASVGGKMVIATKTIPKIKLRLIQGKIRQNRGKHHQS